jgi:phosphoribosylaminoimidazolecarboxamide formyltransferase / IMP cyclohydrolase
LWFVSNAQVHLIAIKSALISVFDKTGLEPLIHVLDQQGVKLYSTGGTLQFIRKMGLEVTSVDELTGFPEVFGGRVKTLHPKVFGGILYRRELEEDRQVATEMGIPSIDLVVVDLYPFEATVKAGGSHEEIIEKIDIGGISLLRAAAKNFSHTAVISSKEQYQNVAAWLSDQKGQLNDEQRAYLSSMAFAVTSHYDTAIFNYLNQKAGISSFKQSYILGNELRYGENPHQNASYFGNLSEVFEQLNGKELSYNNLVDVDAALSLTHDVSGISCAIIKHTNACGMAKGASVLEAYQKALQADPVSAFGGVISISSKIDLACAEALHQLFFEILIAPEFSDDALSLLKEKKNRILLRLKQFSPSATTFKSLLNGVLVQDQDQKIETLEDLKAVTNRTPSEKEAESLLFAALLAKHAKSNTIVLAKDGQLLGSGVGQTSRVDALRQAISKAKSFNMDLNGAAMASDAFFPFPDCVEIAHEAGIQLVIQPGGSIKDQESIDYCDSHQMCMVMTGFRHFRH